MFKILTFIIFPILLLFFLTPLIDNYQYDFLLKKGIFEKDMLYKILGETRKLLSNDAYLKGDEYLHGGIVTRDKSECEGMTHIADHKEGSHEHSHHHEHPHKESEKTSAISKLNILFRLGEMMHITEHIHLHGEEEKELLPWFYYAVRLNPENINAYVIGGYWIGQRLNRTEEAIKFLEEGIRHNPNSWQVYAGLGEIYFIAKKDYRQALTSFQKAYGLINDENADKYDKRRVCAFLAASYEKLGDADKAIEFYRKELILFPRNESVLKKISSLSQKK